MPLVYLPEVVVRTAWNTLYWTTFLLCWVVYPLLQSYSTAGDFTVLDKLRTSLRENAWFYGAGAAVLIIFFFIYLFAAPSNNKNPIPVAMALGNTWGLVLLICLLGYGLVEIPRGFWRSADKEMELKRCRFEVVGARAALVAARESLAKTLRMIRRYEERVERSDPFWPYVKTILAKTPPEYVRVERGEGSAELRYDKLVSLHYNLMAHEHNLRVCTDRYRTVVRRAFEVEDVLRTKTRKSEHAVSWTLRPRRAFRFVAWVEWLWFVKLKSTFLRVVAGTFALLSLVVLWCECFFFFDRPVLSVFALLTKPEAVRTNDIVLSIVIFVPLVYIMVCTYWSFFQLKIFSYYRLVGHQNSDANSLLFSAAYLCRLAAPLSLKFIHMLKFSGSSFQVVMAGMERMPFLGGYSFNSYAPIALVIICVGCFFNIATRLFRCLHIRRFTYDDTIDEKQLEEGRAILERERGHWISGTRLPGDDDFAATLDSEASAGVQAPSPSTSTSPEPPRAQPFTTSAIWGGIRGFFSRSRSPAEGHVPLARSPSRSSRASSSTKKAKESPPNSAVI